MTDVLKVEMIGGGMGASGFAGSHLKNEGVLDWQALDPKDQTAIEAAFRRPVNDHFHPQNHPNVPRYRITRDGANGQEKAEFLVTDAPESVRRAVHARLD